MEIIKRWYRRVAVLLGTAVAAVLVPAAAWAQAGSVDGTAGQLGKGKAIGAAAVLGTLCCLAVVAAVVLVVVVVSRRRKH